MSARDKRRVAATLLCLLPAAAAALDWTARVGLGYDREDQWSPATERQTVPRFDLDLLLDLAGYVASPGILDWRGSVGYRRAEETASGSQSDALTYHASAKVFNHGDSPLKLDLLANRTNSRVESSGGGTTAVGDQVGSAYGAIARLHKAGAPALDLGFFRSQDEERIGSLLNHDRSMSIVSAGFAHAAGDARVNGSYNGQWSDGSWVADQNTMHQVGVVATSSLGSERNITVSDQYYRRAPTTSASDAFGSEINSFRAIFRDGVVGRMSQVSYSDQRAVSASAGVSEETVANSLGYQHDLALSSSEYFLRGTADASATKQRRSDGMSLSSRGGTGGAELWWRRVASGTYEIAAGPRVGLLQAAGDSIRAGYGAFAHASLVAPWRGRQVAAVYDASYGTNLFGQPGWALQQTANGTVSGAAGIGRYNMGVTLAAQRSSTPVFGPAAATSISALAGYAWLRYSLSAQASLSHGIVPGTSGFVGDGLFIPVGFDTLQASAFLHGNVSLSSDLAAHVDASYAESIGPGQPSNSVRGAGCGLSYRFAAFEVSIDDRYQRYQQPTIDYSNNLFFVRVSRAFGSRF